MASGQPQLSRTELENRWRERCAWAADRYKLATAQLSKVLEEQSKREMPPADGQFALQKARKAESNARQDYMAVLKILTDLVVSGKLPPE